MVRLRHGSFADFEPRGRIYAVRQIGQAEVLQVGKWRYDDWGQALTPGAPEIRTICDFRATTKHGNKAVMRDFQGRLAVQIAADREARRIPTDQDRRIDTLNRSTFLRTTCVKCGRSRLEQVGFIITEARMGGRTVGEFARSARCARWDCNGHQSVSIDAQ